MPYSPFLVFSLKLPKCGIGFLHLFLLEENPVVLGVVSRGGVHVLVECGGEKNRSESLRGGRAGGAELGIGES